jgi:hypothetical protein
MKLPYMGIQGVPKDSLLPSVMRLGLVCEKFTASQNMLLPSCTRWFKYDRDKL